MPYEYLTTTTSPRHIAVAISLIGIKEIPGKESNQQILQWAKSVGLEKIYQNDDTSWCALFVCYTMFVAGRMINIETKDPYDYLRALKYQEANLLPVEIKDAAFGDIMIFKRPEGGHIAYYVGEDADNYHVLGGNQGNKVSVVAISKQRCVAVRRPFYVSYSPKKLLVSEKGIISSNEA